MEFSVGAEQGALMTVQDGAGQCEDSERMVRRLWWHSSDNSGQCWTLQESVWTVQGQLDNSMWKVQGQWRKMQDSEWIVLYSKGQCGDSA